MIVTREYGLSDEAVDALGPALARSNMNWADIAEIMCGYGWAVWNCGNLCWVFTMVNRDDEVEVLLAGGKRARECVQPWVDAMLSEPAHRGLTLRVDGRKGWARLLPDWERRDDVLYLKVHGIGQEENQDRADQ